MGKQIDNVFPLQKPHPLPPEHPFGTPSPEDTLIEILDKAHENKEDDKESVHDSSDQT